MNHYYTRGFALLGEGNHMLNGWIDSWSLLNMEGTKDTV